jgi:hypothetical protein
MTLTPAPCSSATHTPATAEMTTPPATLADLLGSLELKKPADVFGYIREELSELLPAWAPDLDTAAALVAMAAQCFYMLEYKPKLFPLMSEPCECNWREQAEYVEEEYVEEECSDSISSNYRMWNDVEKEIEKTSALVYGLARWLDEHQERNEKLHRERQVA